MNPLLLTPQIASNNRKITKQHLLLTYFRAQSQIDRQEYRGVLQWWLSVSVLLLILHLRLYSVYSPISSVRRSVRNIGVGHNQGRRSSPPGSLEVGASRNCHYDRPSALHPKFHLLPPPFTFIFYKIDKTAQKTPSTRRALHWWLPLGHRWKLLKCLTGRNELGNC